MKKQAFKELSKSGQKLRDDLVAKYTDNIMQLIEVDDPEKTKALRATVSVLENHVSVFRSKAYKQHLYIQVLHRQIVDEHEKLRAARLTIRRMKRQIQKSATEAK